MRSADNIYIFKHSKSFSSFLNIVKVGFSCGYIGSHSSPT